MATKALAFCYLCLIGVGFVILVITVCLAWLGLPKIIDSQVKEKVQLVNGSDTWNAWKDVSVPIYMQIYIYNVTNPAEIEAGEKPNVTEMGPYTYLERRHKVDIVVDEDKDTVRYRQPTTFFFDPEKSKGTEDDMITVLNVAYVGVVALGHKLTTEDYILTTLDELITSKGEKLFRTQTVREILFEGFSVQNFLDLLNDPIIQSIGDAKVPRQFASGKFGFFLGRNGSDEGVFEVKSGTDNYLEFGQIVSWNNKTRLPWWNGTCGMLNGTDGSLFRPFLNKQSKLSLFAPDLCRSTYMTFEADTMYEGVPTYRFSLPKKLLQSAPANPDNWCFCTDPNGCHTSGLLNIATCREGSPIIASSPHFLNADPEIIAGVNGISPSAEKHKTFLDLEPRSGLLLNAKKRLQFNMLLKRYEYMPTFENVQTVVFPLIWVEETASVTGENLETLQALTNVFKIVGVVKWVLIGIGACLLIAGVILVSTKRSEIIPKN